MICRDRCAALLTVADEVLTRYGAEKARRGLLDYDDLIDKALALLDNFDAAWVHYKLDLGIDHVLIDEAQDTSRSNGRSCARSSPNFRRCGARDVRRTMFAVGDEKQSIYSFQNAAPKEFAEMRRTFQRAIDAAARIRRRKFEHSFRSGDSVLGAVDRVFKRTESRSVTSTATAFRRISRCRVPRQAWSKSGS